MKTLVQHDIDEYGVHVTNVLGDARHVGWSYTIGLWEGHAHPEIVVSGLPAPTAHRILRAVHRRIEGGERFEHGTVDMRVFTTGRAAFLQIADLGGEHLLGCQSRYGDAFEAVQLVWPDAIGVFPWEEGYSPSPPQERLYDVQALHRVAGHVPGQPVACADWP